MFESNQSMVIGEPQTTAGWCKRPSGNCQRQQIAQEAPAERYIPTCTSGYPSSLLITTRAIWHQSFNMSTLVLNSEIEC